jgi:hypothetical protein
MAKPGVCVVLSNNADICIPVDEQLGQQLHRFDEWTVMTVLYIFSFRLPQKRASKQQQPVLPEASPPPLHPRNLAPSESSMEASLEAHFRISEARSGVQNGRFLMNLVGLLLYSYISLTTFVELYLGSDSMT